MKNEIGMKIAEYLESEKFSETLENAMEKAVNSTVESLFSYGKLRDQIKESFEEKLVLNVKQLDFTAINEIVTQMVKQKTVAAFSEPLREKLSKQLDDMFQPAPKTIKIQGIIDILREEVREDVCGCVDYTQCMTVEVKKCEYRGWDVKIWAEERFTKSYYSSEKMTENKPNLSLYVREDGTMAVIHNLDISKGLATGIFGFDAKMFMMYCAGTVITDIEDCDVDDLDTRIYDHVDY